MKKRYFYTDGCCIPNPGLGSWAFVEASESKEIIFEKTGILEKSTSNRSEYVACIEAMKFFLETKNKDYKALIFSDSELLVNTCNKWIFSWQSNNWTKKKKKDPVIKNLDLVKEIYYLLTTGLFEINWIKGHNGNHFNERCDYLADRAIWLYQINLKSKQCLSPERLSGTLGHCANSTQYSSIEEN